LCSLIISESVAVEIFAIGQPCAKMFRKVWCATFFWDMVYNAVLCKNCKFAKILQFSLLSQTEWFTEKTLQKLWFQYTANSLVGNSKWARTSAAVEQSFGQWYLRHKIPQTGNLQQQTDVQSHFEAPATLFGFWAPSLVTSLLLFDCNLLICAAYSYPKNIFAWLLLEIMRWLGWFYWVS